MLVCTLAGVVLTGCEKPSTMYLDAGMAYLENHEYEAAYDNFLLSIEKEGATKEAYRGLGIAYVSLGMYAESVEAFITALSKSNARIQTIDYDINAYMGYAYEMMGDYGEAVSVYTALISVKPRESDYYYRRALCYLNMGEFTKADEDFNVVTSKDPSNYDLHLKIFAAIRNLGFTTEAESYLKALLNDETRKISDYDRGRMYYYISDYSQARVYLEKAKDMSNPETVLMLGKTYEAVSDYSYAASLYNSFLTAKGNNAAVYNQLGVCRWKLGDYDGALTAFSFGLKLEDPEWTKELMFNEAITYEYLYDYDCARLKFEEYVKLFPNDEAAARELIFLSTR